MNNDDILDADLDAKELSWRLAVKWWEKKRMVYNIIFIGTQIMMMLVYWKGTLQYGLEYAVIDSFIVVLIANMCYCLGWGLEILADYYFNYELGERYRNVCYALGIGFSVVLALLAYSYSLM